MNRIHHLHLIIRQRQSPCGADSMFRYAWRTPLSEVGGG
jgi:hypothetical protein